MSDVSVERLADMVVAGLTYTEIGAEVGLSEGGVRNRLRRAGIDAKADVLRRLRTRAEDLPPREAVDFLLGALDRLELSMTDKAHPVDAWGVHLTPMQRRIAICLFDAGGAMRHPEQLHAACYWDARDDGADVETIKVQLMHIRRKLADVCDIETVWGRGYRMTVIGGAE